MDWLHLGSVTLTSFLASLVEGVEALTIVLAVGSTRNWKSALSGTGAALVALIVLIAALGPSIQKVPLTWMQLVVGSLVLVFGLNWLRKATLRSAGLKALHDEEASYAEEVQKMRAERPLGAPAEFDKIAFLTSFKAVFLEGFEVAFIVITAGSVSGHFAPAFIGAAAALTLVVALGFVLHKPLSRVPENSLKKCVGILLSAFGFFWVGEGLGFEWPGGDAAIVLLAVAIGGASLALSALLKRRFVRAVKAS